MKYKQVILLVIPVFFVISGFSQKNKPSYEVLLSFKKTDAMVWNDLKMKITVTSLKDTGINIPMQIRYSGVSYPTGDICFEVEKKKDMKYQECPIANIDYFTDQGNSVWKLPLNKSMVKEENLNLFYVFDKGDYRARIYYHASKFNRDTEDISSAWVCFRVLSDTIKIRHPEN